MANIESIDVESDRVVAKVVLSTEEYEALNSATSDILLAPVGDDSLTRQLTVGKIGNGNRMMLPNKVLRVEGIERLPRKAPARIFTLRGNKYLVACIKGDSAGIPFFDLKAPREAI